MRRVFLALTIPALAVFAACSNAALSNPVEPAGDRTANVNKSSSQPAAAQEEAPRITLADAKKEFDAGAAVFIDTRAEAAFQAEHIQGAINIPAAEFETRYKEVPKNKKIIAYCS